MAINTSRGGGFFSDINITPLTDIFLVLLIIFMITTAVTIESAAHVDLPRVERPQTREKPKGVLVTCTSAHRIYVGHQSIPLSKLAPVLRNALMKSPEKLVVFQGDPKVTLGDMVRILDIAKTAGADGIAIAVGRLPANDAPGSGASASGM